MLNVASSGIASLLLSGGCTTHSRFAIPLNLDEYSTCNISQGSPTAERVKRSKLIIWDGAPMMHRHCFEALDKTLKDIMGTGDLLFGGKTVVLGGDFRQILPVIPKGTRQDIVSVIINSSYLWNDCKVLRLTKNMRLVNLGSNDKRVELEQFANWIASIGDGTIGDPNNGKISIDIPDHMLLKCSEDPIKTIVESIYPSLENISEDASSFQDKAILAPTLEVVQAVNEYMISLNMNDTRTYLSSDSICKSYTNADILHDLHTPEFLNSINCSGVPNHELNQKVGTPVMLLRNIDHSLGLCNGTRLVITRLGNHVLEAEIIAGSNAIVS